MSAACGPQSTNLRIRLSYFVATNSNALSTEIGARTTGAVEPIVGAAPLVRSYACSSPLIGRNRSAAEIDRLPEPDSMRTVVTPLSVP